MYYYLGVSLVIYALMISFIHGPMECFHCFDNFILLTIKNESLGAYVSIFNSRNREWKHPNLSYRIKITLDQIGLHNFAVLNVRYINANCSR